MSGQEKGALITISTHSFPIDSQSIVSISHIQCLRIDLLLQPYYLVWYPIIQRNIARASTVGAAVTCTGCHNYVASGLRTEGQGRLGALHVISLSSPSITLRQSSHHHTIRHSHTVAFYSFFVTPLLLQHPLPCYAASRVTAIPYYIKEFIQLEGGNKYKEGVQEFKRNWTGTRVKGRLSKLQFINQKTQH